MLASTGLVTLPCGGSALRFVMKPTRIDDARLQPMTDQLEQAFVIGALFQNTRQPCMIHVVEQTLNVRFDDVLAALELFTHSTV